MNNFRNRGFTIWLYGLPGSGKTTIAHYLYIMLNKKNNLVKVLDNDEIRKGLCADLDFTQKDRDENIRRISHVSKLMNDIGVITLCNFISPLRKNRKDAKVIIGFENFYECFIDTPLDVCKKRDPKGLYKKAERREIKNFTGVSAPFEIPLSPDIVLKTEGSTPQILANELYIYLKNASLIFENKLDLNYRGGGCVCEIAQKNRN